MAAFGVRSDLIQAFFAREIDKDTFVTQMRGDGAPPRQIADVIEEAEQDDIRNAMMQDVAARGEL